MESVTTLVALSCIAWKNGIGAFQGDQTELQMATFSLIVAFI